MIPFLGRGGSSGRMQPPPVPPLQAGHHQRSSPTSSGVQQQRQQPQPGYPTGSVGSMDERSFRRRRMDDASGLSVAQQQQHLAGYSTRQYQNQNQAHWHGSGAPPTNAPPTNVPPTDAPVSRPPQPAYGYSSTSADPSYSHHAHHAYALTPMYAAPIPTAPPQWTGSGGTQGQEQYYHTGAAAYSQAMQVYQQPSYTSPTQATGTYQVHTPAGSAGSGPGSITRPTPPMASGTISPSATVPLVTSSPLSLSARPEGAAGPVAERPAAVGSQAPHENSSTQGREYSLGAAGYPQLVQAQPYPAYATSAEVVPLSNDPPSRVSPQSPQATFTASGVAPNSGAGPSGANINIGGASMVSGPMSSDQRVGLRRRDRTSRRQDSKPYKRALATSRKSRPITYEGNLERLLHRCRSQGADEGAIGLLGRIFADEISLEALTRRLTDAEAETREFGIDTGMLYTALLEHPAEEDDGYACGLCSIEKTWKHHRDVLRHLRRDHFGISEGCDQCNQKFYTKNEKKRHLCK